MYLTRFRVNSARRGARKLLSSPQALHAAILCGFAEPSHHTTDFARTLWRLDRLDHNQINLYIVSPNAPDLTHLVEQAGWPTTEAWLTRPYSPFLDTLQKGQQWAFRLTANPTRDGRKAKDAGQTQRFGAVTVEQQATWLTSRAGRNGFAVSEQGNGSPNLVIHNRQISTFARRRGEKSVTLATATYDGVLTIDDVERFRHLLTNGIGHGRAYGCGLLTLAPAEVSQ